MERFRGHNDHGLTEPRYGTMVGYSAFSESYASKSEQVVEYGGYPPVGMLNHQLLQPAWNSSPHDRPKKGVRPADSTWKNVHTGNSPPPKNHPGKYNNSSSDESDDEDNVVYDENGYGYPKSKYAENYDNGNHDYATNYGYPTQGNHPSHEPSSYHNNNHKSKPNGNGYTTPHPQPYHVTPNPKGNDYTAPHPQPYCVTPNPNGNDYTAHPPQPHIYETPNNKPMMHKPLPSVKTRLVDHPNKGTVESQVENMRISSPASAKSQRSPFATSSPKSSPKSSYSSPRKDQGYRDTIDSMEARRRYGGASVGAPVEQYKGTIDSQEAARRYRGVFVNY